MSWEGRRSGLLGSTVKRMMFVHARLMKFDRVLLIGRYRRRHEKYDTKKRCNTRTSQEVTHPSTTLAQARLSCGVTMGSGALVFVGRGRRSGLLGSTVKRMMFVHARLMKFDRVLLIDQVSSASRKYDTKKRCNTRTSREVTHPSTTLAQARLTAEFDGIRCISAWYDRTLPSVARSMVIWIRRTHD
ncbi:unnamed protein product [Sphenostylis stenocarpa]|uniref:Uncharacterized protein n=1 Tax=Sphenostylis stenocarpa TaxID=92480 RepID=A0AA86SMY9_9FABA|nr:unnamed protein product [Sphenostylis stenocarpa]